MASHRTQVKLGKGSAFVKSRLKRLHQEEEVWEADFRALPKPPGQSITEYFGMVVTQPEGFHLADLHVEGSPTVNDLAKLLSDAMRRPFVGGAHRPSRILLRKHPQWQELLPHLKDIGIEVAVEDELSMIEDALEDYLRVLEGGEEAAVTDSPSEQEAVEKQFPAIAKWTNERYGHIEIGDQEIFGFVARALSDGSVVYEDQTSETFAQAMNSLEVELTRWFWEEGISIDEPA